MIVVIMELEIVFLVLAVAYCLAWGGRSAINFAESQNCCVSVGGIAFIDLYIAQDRGFFREEGLNAELIQVAANVATAALVSGEVDALGAVGLGGAREPNGFADQSVGGNGPPGTFLAG